MKWKDLKIKELESWKINETENLELLRRDFFAWKEAQTKEIADMRRITMEEIANHKRISLEEIALMKARAMEEIASMKQRAQLEIENEWQILRRDKEAFYTQRDEFLIYKQKLIKELEERREKLEIEIRQW